LENWFRHLGPLEDGLNTKTRRLEGHEEQLVYVDGSGRKRSRILSL
jgi:hypothetical protein